MRLLAAGVVALVAALAAHAESPQSSPDWSSDRFLLGAWSCDVVRSGHKPARETAGCSMGLGDRWLNLTYTLTSGEPNIPPVTTESYESFDKKLKKWVYVSMGSDGEFTEDFDVAADGGTWRRTGSLRCSKTE